MKALPTDPANPQGPLFSVITPVYQCGEKIRATIDSILSQDASLFEYRVIDGNSADATCETVRSYGPAVQLISEKDRGVYDAMNKGIAHATGQFLYFIGAGDTLRPGILRQVAHFIESHTLARSPDPCFLYGDVFSEEMQETYGRKTNRFRLTSRNICHQGIFYDRRIFTLLASGYDLRYRILADYHLNLRCFGHPGIRKVRIPEIIANYESAGLSSSEDRDFRNDEAMLIRQHLGWPALAYYKGHHRWLTLRHKLGIPPVH